MLISTQDTNMSFLRGGRAPLLLVLFCSTLGLFPHLIFSAQMGELFWFKGAWDEDYYIRLMFTASPQPARWLSLVAYRVFWWLSGNNLDITVILFDTVFPSLCISFAYFCASRIVNSYPHKMLLAMVLVFGTDLFLFSNMTIMPNICSISTLRNRLPLDIRKLIPETTIAYLTIFRTPEPQVSWPILFAFLAFISHVAGKQTLGLKSYHWGIVLIFSLCTPFVYTFIAIPLLILEALVFTRFLLEKKWFLFIAAESAVVAGMAWWLLGSVFIGTSTKSFDLVFQSRLPVLSPTILLCSFAIIAELYFLYSKKRLIVDSLLGLSSLLVPIILDNQQIITGRMISCKEWERYACCVFFLYGVMQLKIARYVYSILFKTQTLQNIFCVSVFFCFSLLCCYAQVVNYNFFYRSNLVSVLEYRLLKKVPSEKNKLRILLDDPYFSETLLNVRMNFEISVVHGYSDLIDNFIARIPPDESAPQGRIVHQRRAFEVLARQGVRPSTFEEEMAKAAKAHTCWPHLIAFFSLLDTWGPASDDREINEDVILRQIPKIKIAYEEYLIRRNLEWDSDVLFLSERSPAELVNENFSSELLGVESLGKSYKTKNLYLYLQSRKKRDTN